jgi:hypothetical protein
LWVRAFLLPVEVCRGRPLHRPLNGSDRGRAKCPLPQRISSGLYFLIGCSTIAHRADIRGPRSWKKKILITDAGIFLRRHGYRRRGPEADTPPYVAVILPHDLGGAGQWVIRDGTSSSEGITGGLIAFCSHCELFMLRICPSIPY